MIKDARCMPSKLRLEPVLPALSNCLVRAAFMDKKTRKHSRMLMFLEIFVLWTVVLFQGDDSVFNASLMVGNWQRNRSDLFVVMCCSMTVN